MAGNIYNNPQGAPQGGVNGLPAGFDHAGFQQAQQRTEASGTQISPDEFYRYAGVQAGQQAPGSLQNTYQQLYGNTAFYNPNSSTTPNAPPTANLFPNYSSPGSYQAMGPAAQATDFIPQNVTASPLYQWQQQQGSEALARLASARGYTNSGREIQGVSDFTSQLTAQETERQRQQANLAADRENSRRAMNTQQGNQFTMAAAQDRNSFNGAQAGLFGNFALDSADRQERLSNTQWNRMTGVLDRMLAQSPYASGVASNSAAANSIQANANAAAGLYGQLGNAYASAIAPQYSGADTSASQGFNVFGNASNNLSTSNLYSNFFGDLFKPKTAAA